MTENIEYIAELTQNKDNFFNLFITTYNGNTVEIDFFICERTHNMRLDKVSNEIYGTTKYQGTLCQLNNIIDPWSIRDGDIIAYTSRESADALLKVADIIKQSGIDELLSKAKSDLINALKGKQKDPNRRTYLSNRGDDKLPPTILPNSTPQIVIDNNKIKITPNLFNTPATSSQNIPDAISGPLDNISPVPSDDQIERVLVRRYIKQITNN